MNPPRRIAATAPTSNLPVSPASPGGEQRHFHRVPFQVEAQLLGPAGSARVRVIDLSLRGALVEPPAGWGPVPAGAVMELDIQLDTAGEARIQMRTQVAHADSARLGLRCVHIDLDSVTVLRRLVAVNLGDAGALERELSTLG